MMLQTCIPRTGLFCTNEQQDTVHTDLRIKNKKLKKKPHTLSASVLVLQPKIKVNLQTTNFLANTRSIKSWLCRMSSPGEGKWRECMV